MGKLFKFGAKTHYKRKQQMRMYNLNKSLEKLENELVRDQNEQISSDIDSVVEPGHDSEENDSHVLMSSMNGSLDNNDHGCDESVELSDNENMERGEDISDDSGGESSNDSGEEDCNDTSGEQSNGSSDDGSSVSRHNNGNCPFDELYIVKEIRIGFHSKFIFRCGNCRRKFRVLANDDERTTDTVDINSSAVLGANLTGIGYSTLEQFASVVDVPSMSYDKFKTLNDKMGKFWTETAERTMREAAMEEARLAILRGDVDPIDGTPFITVVTDACWSKRSYNKNFTALSGVGAIVGANTGKVLWIGVRNRYCVICVRAKNRDVTPRQHPCTCNFTGPSSEMEWETILEGFKSSVELYNLRYLKVISDGDSSTYSKLLEHKPYQDRHIEKIECTNHLFRNFRKNLEAAVKGCPRGLNKHVMDNLQRIRKDIHCAVQFRKKGNTSEDETVSLLKSDLDNTLRHVFGDHSKCPTYIKSFCTNDKNYVPALEECSTFEKMSAVMRKLMYCAKDLLLGEINNPAEHFNSIVAKFVGGKRVNFSLSNAYGYRSHAAAVQFNTQAAFKCQVAFE